MRFKTGDRVRIKAHKSHPGERVRTKSGGWRPGPGLTYGAGVVTVAEDGASGGWDVYDREDGGAFYGFSVERVYRARASRGTQPKGRGVKGRVTEERGDGFAYADGYAAGCTDRFFGRRSAAAVLCEIGEYAAGYCAANLRPARPRPAPPGVPAWTVVWRSPCMSASAFWRYESARIALDVAEDLRSTGGEARVKSPSGAYVSGP